MDQTFVSLLGIVVVLVLQLLAGVWWAATINSNVKHLTTNVKSLTMDAAVHHAEQEASLKAMWLKHDELKERVKVIETKCESNHPR